MATLSRDQLYSYARAAGFTGAALDEVVAIALAESGGNTTHVNVNAASTTTIGGKTTKVPAGTKDRGVLQINDWWNPSVSDTCAFDPTCSFQWAFKVTGGKQPTSSSDPFKPYWVTVQNGAYKKYLTSGSASGVNNPVASGVGTTAGATTGAAAPAIPFIDLSPITNWLASMQGLWDWLSNPIRVIKLIVGIMLVAGSIFLLVSPEGNAAAGIIQDVLPEAKAQPKEAKEDE
jgi:hypothetical protein